VDARDPRGDQKSRRARTRPDQTRRRDRAEVHSHADSDGTDPRDWRSRRDAPEPFCTRVKQGDTLAPVLFLCYIQAVLETLFPKFEAAGIEKLQFRSMQPKPAVDGEMAAGSLMVKPAVFHSGISHAPSLPKSVMVHTGNIAIVPQSAGPTNCPKPPSLFAPRAVQLIGAQVRCKRKSCTKSH
jgi:hypothetical protein